MSYYTVEHITSNTLKVTMPTQSTVVFRTTYDKILSKNHGIDSKYKCIVYLLAGRKSDGRECLYVGKSTGGVDGRPKDHEDKKAEWKYCFVFSSTNEDLNDSVIQCVENGIKEAILNTKQYCCETNVTTNNAGNKRDNEIAKSFIQTLLDIYDILGIHLNNPSNTLQRFIKQDSFDKPVTSDSGFSAIKLTPELRSWFKTAESIVYSLDKNAETKVRKAYVSFKHNGLTAAYCYPLISSNEIRIYFRGTKEIYSDPKVVDRDEKVHNGDCKAMFFIRSNEDLRYFELFMKIAIDQMDGIKQK